MKENPEKVRRCEPQQMLRFPYRDISGSVGASA